MNKNEDMQACIVCGHRLRPGVEPWHARCPQCGYELSTLEPSINVAASHEAVDEVHREAALKPLRQQNFRRILELIAQQGAGGGKALLDVGAAHGWFLELARDRFDVLGIEPDEAVREKAAARGLPMRAGYFPDALEPGQAFDVIVFNDVIEHIPRIDQALAACHERLRPGGLLVLNLPSRRGLFYRTSKLLARCGWRGPFERMWQKGFPSPHVHYFDSPTLQALVTRHGFAVERMEQLPSIRLRGTWDRIRYAGQASVPSAAAQFLAVLAMFPVARVFPSDTIVGIFRKQAQPA